MFLLADEALEVFHALEAFAADADDHVAGAQRGARGVGRESFKSVEDFERLIGEQKQGDTVALLVRRGEATVYVPVEVG